MDTLLMCLADLYRLPNNEERAFVGVSHAESVFNNEYWNIRPSTIHLAFLHTTCALFSIAALLIPHMCQICCCIVCVCYNYAYFSSRLDMYQHHYLMGQN